MCLGIHQNGKCSNFTLLFCRGPYGLVHKSVLHDYFSTLDQSNSQFMALSLPFPSLMLKLPNKTTSTQYTASVRWDRLKGQNRNTFWSSWEMAAQNIEWKQACFSLPHFAPTILAQPLIHSMWQIKLFHCECDQQMQKRARIHEVFTNRKEDNSSHTELNNSGLC